MTKVEFSERIDVGTDVETTWALLFRLDLLTEWIGIVHDAKEIEPRARYEAVLSDRVGPFKVRAELDIRLSVTEPGRRLEVLASGEDRHVASQISADAVLVVQRSGPRTSTVDLRGSYDVTGRLATMGQSMVRQKGDAMIRDFAHGLRRASP